MSGFDHEGYAKAIEPYNQAMNDAGVTMTVASGAPFQEWSSDMRAFTVTLTYDGRKLTIPFYMGSATVGDPTVSEVVHSLGVDVSCAYETFDEYLGEFLHADDRTPDTLKDARRVWKACVRQAAKAKRLFGDDMDAIFEKVADL